MAEFDQLRNLLKGHLIKILAGLWSARFSSHTDEMLLQRDWSERRVEKEKTSMERDAA